MQTPKLIANEWIAPLKAPLENPTTRTMLLGAAVVGISGLTFLKPNMEQIQDYFRKHRPLKNYDRIGNDGGQFLPNLIYTLFFASDYLLHDRHDSYKRAYSMFTASLYSGLVTDFFKVVVNEKRPNGGRHSFPSGHTTTAFAFSGYVALEHGNTWGIIAYSFSTYVALSRLNSNAHYLHNVIVGGLIGAAYGISSYQNNYLNQIVQNKRINLPFIYPQFENINSEQKYSINMDYRF